MVGEKRGLRYVVAVTFIGLALFMLGSLASISVNRQNISFGDAQDMTLDPDFDITSMGGDLEGRFYRVDMTVAGTIQTSGRYVIDIVAELNGNRHIYGLDVTGGKEDFYGAEVFTSDNTISMLFPLDKLLPGAVIIGIEGVAWGSEGPDYAQEMERAELSVSKMLPLPFLALILLVPGSIMLFVGMVILVKAVPPESW